MAIDKRLKIYDDQGHDVDYDIMADDVKFMPDGKDLPTKLAEMEEEIGEGGYTPPAGGIPKTDLAPSVQTSLGKADTALQAADKTQLQAAINAVQTALNALIGGNVQGAIDTFNEVVTFLNGIDTSDPTLKNQLLALNNAITALQTALAGKISGIKANGASTTLPVDQNGIVTLPPAGSTISPATAAPVMDGAASVGISDKYAREDHVHPKDTSKLSKSDISVETQGDGTVDINVKDDTYAINLNHTHEGMAKLEKVTEATLPQTFADDTIYVQVDDLTTPTEIEALHIFGLEFTGGGVPAGTPAITKPSGASINLGENSGSGVSKTIEIKANSHITGDLTVGLAANSDLSFDTTNLPSGVTYNSGAGTLTIAQATAMQGVNITIVYSGSGGAEIEGGLNITGGGATPKLVDVVVVVAPPYFPEGFLADTAWERAGEELDYPDSVQGYCTNPFTSQFAVAHDSSHKYDLIIKGGFVKNNGELTRGKTMFKLSLNASKTNAAYTHSSDPLRLNDTDNSTTHLYNYVSATFKTSEIDNCYIYDNVAHVYLWAGKNVDTSVAPTIPNS